MVCRSEYIIFLQEKMNVINFVSFLIMYMQPNMRKTLTFKLKNRGSKSTVFHMVHNLITNIQKDYAKKHVYLTLDKKPILQPDCRSKSRWLHNQ